MLKPKHREVVVNLNGIDGWVEVTRSVTNALRRVAVPESEVEEFREETRKQENFQDLLNLCRAWVEVIRDDE